MGYTHYWTFKKTKTKAAIVEKSYQKAITDIAKIVKYSKKNAVNLSGYTAHCDIGQYGGINFNGVKKESHENFILREHFNQNFEDTFSESFNFCKTARKPYDVVVTAALIVLKFRLKDNINIASDGSYSDWFDGLELAKRVLRLRSLKIPVSKD